MIGAPGGQKPILSRIVRFSTLGRGDLIPGAASFDPVPDY
jgi:hypothetical protein